ncbi:FMN-binding protein [Methyloversatilis thermotolerans]|uniref:FMN-binding protein n=1 Tax=Methyloversatilis thermotolerans TaxID=1346290 RepID=UPI00037C5BAD|nr:FMN-binding protein [Methyloversatilis thermotolerans]
MKWTPAASLALVPVAAVLAPAVAEAKIYVSVEDTQQRLFPGERLILNPVALTEAQRERMRELSSVREPFRGERVWKSEKGGWFIVDEVVGKHEMVKYALAINADGTIRGIEIMEYVESYGYEVGEASWRAQFVGRTAQDTLKLNKDIKNIAGATLSCKHLTDGVKRLMVMYDMVLKGSK